MGWAIVGIGVAMAQWDEYGVALGLLIFGSLVILLQAYHWEGFENFPGLSKALRSLYVVGASVMFIVAYPVTNAKRGDKPWSDAWGRYTHPAVRQTTTPQSQPVEQPTHTMLVRYSEGALPIRIAPEDTAYILQLNPNITQWVWEIQNTGKTPMMWPADLHPKKTGPPPEPTYVCTLTNDEQKTLLDVSIAFKITFHELETLPVIVKRKKDGTQDVTIQRPGADHVVVVINRPGSPPTSARDGALVKEFEHSVSIPSLHAGQSVKIYLVNQSALISKFTFPSEASAIVAGDARRAKIALVRPDTTVMDRLPWFGLGPALYHWKGVPGAP